MSVLQSQSQSQPQSSSILIDLKQDVLNKLVSALFEIRLSKPKTKTQIFPSILPKDYADNLFSYLKNNVKWEAGVKSKRYGFTRLAKAIADIDSTFPILRDVIKFVMVNMKIDSLYEPYGIYLNYQQNKDHWTPMHSHADTIQMVISLGYTRDFVIGTKTYKLNSGDACIFGTSSHGVPKSKVDVGERISIAVFMKPI